VWPFVLDVAARPHIGLESYLKDNITYVGFVSGVHSPPTKQYPYDPYVNLFNLVNGETSPLFDSFRVPTYSGLKTFYKSFKKNLQKPDSSIDCPFWDVAARRVEAFVKPIFLRATEYSFQDAWESMNKNSSVGFPLNREYKDKKDFQNRGWHHLLQYLDNYPNVAPPIWSVHLKQEIRELEKDAYYQEDKISKVRTFVASPVTYSVMGNYLCLSQNEELYRSALSGFSCVGMSKYHGQFNQIVNRFPGYKVLSVDGSNFDGSVRIRDHEENCRLRAMSYGGRKRLLFWSWYYDSIHKYYLLPNGDLVLVHGTQSSGNVNTATDNTLTMNRNATASTIRICHELGLPDDAVCVLNYSDDVLVLCKEEFLFDPLLFYRYMDLSGYPCTGTDKWEDVSKLEFLSHTLVLLPQYGMYVPIPRPSRIFGGLKWGNTAQSIHLTLLRACALRMESFFIPECRLWLESFIGWLLNNYRAELDLKSEVHGVILSLDLIMTTYLDARSIVALYLGFESGSFKINAALSHLLSLVNNDSFSLFLS